MDLATRRMVYYGFVGLLLAGSAIGVFQVTPQVAPVPFLIKYGTLSIYMSSVQSDIPGNQAITSNPSSSRAVSTRLIENLLSLNVTVDFVTIHQSADPNGKGMVIPNTKFTFDVLRPFNVSTLISSARVPAENVTSVSLHVSKATAAVLGAGGLQPVSVPSDELRVSVSPGLEVDSQLNSSIVISGTAHVVFEGSGKIKLTPTLHVEKTTGPQS